MINQNCSRNTTPVIKVNSLQTKNSSNLKRQRTESPTPNSTSKNWLNICPRCNNHPANRTLNLVCIPLDPADILCPNCKKPHTLRTCPYVKRTPIEDRDKLLTKIARNHTTRFKSYLKNTETQAKETPPVTAFKETRPRATFRKFTTASDTMVPYIDEPLEQP